MNKMLKINLLFKLSFMNRKSFEIENKSVEWNTKTHTHAHTNLHLVI